MRIADLAPGWCGVTMTVAGPQMRSAPQHQIERSAPSTPDLTPRNLTVELSQTLRISLGLFPFFSAQSRAQPNKLWRAHALTEQ